MSDFAKIDDVGLIQMRDEYFAKAKALPYWDPERRRHSDFACAVDDEIDRRRGGASGARRRAELDKLIAETPTPTQVAIPTAPAIKVYKDRDGQAYYRDDSMRPYRATPGGGRVYLIPRT